MELISVVIPTLGKSPLLADALDALHRERQDGVELEVILVGPSGVVSGPPGPVDRCVDTGGPRGFAEATNRGIDTARGDRIAVLNDDAVIEAGWCRTLNEALDTLPNAAAVQGVNLRLDDPRLVDGAGVAWTRSWQAVQIQHGQPAPTTVAPPAEVFAVSATAALYRRRALRETGSFDVGLDSYYEDVDLGARLRSLGWTAWTLPAARALHAGSVTGGARPVRRWRLLYGNRWLVVARLLGRHFPRHVPRLLARDLRDLGRAVPALDIRRVVGLVSGLARAIRHLGGWAHRGRPLVTLRELDRFQVSS